jgi:hypothetical protein
MSTMEKREVCYRPFCLALMQNLSDDVQRDLARSLKLLDDDPMPADQKTSLLGLELVNVVGIPVLPGINSELSSFDRFSSCTPPSTPCPSKCTASYGRCVSAAPRRTRLS